VPELARRSTWCSAIWKTPFRPDAKEAARKGFIAMAKATDFGATGLWTRINALKFAVGARHITEIVATIGNKLDVMMLPKVEGAWDIIISISCSPARSQISQKADPDPRHSGNRARRQQCRTDCAASPAYARHEPRSCRPRRLAQHEDHRVGGGHPDYFVLADGKPGDARHKFQQDSGTTPPPDGGRLCGGRHQTFFMDHSGIFRSGWLRVTVPQRLPDGLRRGVVAASDANAIAKRVFRRTRPRSRWRKKILDACRTAAAR